MQNDFEIIQLREKLSNANFPLFYFDNDQDGLCSFLILRRFCGKGVGIPVKSSPLDMKYYRRINEFKPDCIFILDQPSVSKEFFEELKKENIPVVWIDHHEIDLSTIPEEVQYYNSLYSGKKENIPVTQICYSISSKQEDIWLNTIGCISDKFFPTNYGEFQKKFPDLSINSNSPFEIYYKSQIGKIAQMLGTGLKDRTTNVNRMIRFLISVKSPYEILEENKNTIQLHKRFEKLDEKLNSLISKAKKSHNNSNYIFFKYSGETSMSADLSNKLSYLYPNKTIVVAFMRGGRVNLSLRGKNVSEKLSKIMDKFPLSTWGGHKDAVGAQLNTEQIDDFFEELKKLN